MLFVLILKIDRFKERKKINIKSNFKEKKISYNNKFLILSLFLIFQTHTSYTVQLRKLEKTIFKTIPFDKEFYILLN
jgi:hypothetical protein